MALGYAFQPGTNQPNGEQSGATSTPLQSAIKLLSLRLPSVTGARGIAPHALLNGQGGGVNIHTLMGTTPGPQAGMATPTSAVVLQRLLRLISGGGGGGGITGGPQGGVGGLVPPSVPSPRITLGLGEGGGGGLPIPSAPAPAPASAPLGSDPWESYIKPTAGPFTQEPYR
jgi:hypothetical protein